MAPNLRVDFKEGQCKCLSESIMVIHPPTKKPCTKILCPELVSTIALVPEPSTFVAGTSHAPVGRPSFSEKASYPKLGGPSTSLAYLNDDSIECVASISSCHQAPCAPNQEKIVELLKQVPCFTESEALVNNIGGLFPATRRVSVDLDNDPNIFFMARFPFGTLDFVASRILPMQEYTTFEVMEVVSFLSSSVQGALAPLYLDIFLVAFFRWWLAFSI